MKRKIFLIIFHLIVAVIISSSTITTTTAQNYTIKKFLQTYNESMASQHESPSSLSYDDILLASAGELRNDENATDVKHSVKRRNDNSFLPNTQPSSSLSSSSSFSFRDLLARYPDANAERISIANPPQFSRPHKKPSFDAHKKMPFRYTREVQIKQGKIIGIVREMSSKLRLKNVDQFLGIPYAEAPIDSRRFMPPSPPLAWQGVKYANKMGDVCPQKLPNLADSNGFTKGRYDQIKRLLPFLTSESEDCLYLNLYVTSYGEFPLTYYLY